MQYAKVIDGQIQQVGLPDVGTLKNGCTVSNYNLLDQDTLKSEGWLPIEETLPELQDGESLEGPEYTVAADKVIATYKVIPTL